MRDVEIRAALVERLRRSHPDTVENVIRSEMSVGLGASRVDIGLVNGRITGYEIKSDRDNLDRLPGQVEQYGLCLDRAYIVVSERRSESIRSHVPAWWGILTARSGSKDTVVLTETRRPRANPSIDAFSVAQLLWRDEAYEELEIRGLHAGLARATRWDLWDQLATLPLDELRDTVRRRLKARA